MKLRSSMSTKSWPCAPRIVSVVVEPREGFTDDEVAAELNRAGAENVTLLAPGFISADAPPDVLAIIEQIAHVHQSPIHQMHTR